MNFIKMHGIGNDYVFVDCFEETITEELSDLSRRISDRHFGVGSDGLILIEPSEKAPVRMRMFNSDGTEAEMCGNGLRCVAKYVFDQKKVEDTTFPIETGAGILTVEVTPGPDGLIEKVRINMGQPRLRRNEIPMTGEPDANAIGETIEINGRRFQFTAVSMGNPHCVIFIDDDVNEFDLTLYGPQLEEHPLFPDRTNVEFVNRVNEDELIQRTWERGAGETLACGTGASAVCVAGSLLKLTDRKVLIHLRGGDLELEWAEDGSVFKTGPATEVFRGNWKE